MNKDQYKSRVVADMPRGLRIQTYCRISDAARNACFRSGKCQCLKEAGVDMHGRRLGAIEGDGE